MRISLTTRLFLQKVLNKVRDGYKATIEKDEIEIEFLKENEKEEVYILRRKK